MERSSILYTVPVSPVPVSPEKYADKLGYRLADGAESPNLTTPSETNNEKWENEGLNDSEYKIEIIVEGPNPEDLAGVVGHSALRVTTPDGSIVYNLYPSATEGSQPVIQKGVLHQQNWKEWLLEELKSNTDNRDITGYSFNITKNQAEEISRYMEGLIESNKLGSKASYSTKQNYNFFSNNCTTMVTDAIEQIMPGFFSGSAYARKNIPISLEGYLNSDQFKEEMKARGIIDNDHSFESLKKTYKLGEGYFGSKINPVYKWIR